MLQVSTRPTWIIIVMGWANPPSPSQHASLLALPATAGRQAGSPAELQVSTGTLLLLPEVYIAVCMHNLKDLQLSLHSGLYLPALHSLGRACQLTAHALAGLLRLLLLPQVTELHLGWLN